ncbi:C-type lectin domain family 10 member A-like [Mya arenaria]|uniref:C-type lectin domain family 10 member A-like n=1 Tax=Mya arenaria TaxID=6604 RepID=UPI0022E3DB5A|nr:C-type lectin domain family 10 member A-like [Mya arenaria]
MRGRTAILGLFLVMLPDLSLATDCPDGWMAYNASCYLFAHDSMHYVEAEKFCEHLYSHLVRIDTQEENIFLSSFLANIKDPYHWIGLTDDVIEGLWKWHDTDQVATFTNWYPGQPDGHRNANCASIRAALKFKWTDQGCQESYKPLCEKASVY